MKAAAFTNDDRAQLILTPETEWEKALLKQFSNTGSPVLVHMASFFNCNGGWTRFDERGDESLILVRDESKTPKPGIAEDPSL